MGSVFAEEASEVLDDLKFPVAKVVLNITKKTQKGTRGGMQEIMEGFPLVRKLVLDAVLEALDWNDAKREEFALDFTI